MKTNLITLAMAFAVFAFSVVHAWAQRWTPMRTTAFLFLVAAIIGALTKNTWRRPKPWATRS